MPVVAHRPAETTPAAQLHYLTSIETVCTSTADHFTAYNAL